jgi:hypothetical protein
VSYNNRHNIPIKSIPPIKLYADLSAAAFKKGFTTQLELWHILRSLPSVSGGNITADSVCQLVKQLIPYGYTERTAFRQLSEANRLFWCLCQVKGRAVIKIYGLFTVCKALGIARFTLGRNAKLVNAGVFNSLVKRNSQLYASIFKPEGVRANPITREVINRLTGLSITQQRRYEKAAGIRRTPNFEVQQINGHTLPVTMTVSGRIRIYTIPRRLGNTYHSSQELGHKGQAGRVAKTMNKGSFLADETLPLSKVFFTSLRRVVSYFKGVKSSSKGYYLVRNRYRLIKGRMEWCFHQDSIPLFRGLNCDF